MLTCEQGGWHEHGNLLAILDCLEGGANGNLGLAIADVTGKQTVHRNLALHVALDLIDGGQLVRCLDECERLFELMLPRCVWAECVAARLHTGRIKLDQVDCDLANGLARVALGSSPVAAAHLGKHRSFAAYIASQQVKLVGWHEQGVARVSTLGWRVFDEQVFALVLLTPNATGALHEFNETADAVCLVNHVVAGL